MFIQEAKQVAFNFRLQQMCHYKKQKFTHDQKMTSHYIVYNFTASLKPFEIIQSFQRINVEERKHLLRWASKLRTTREIHNCSWLRNERSSPQLSHAYSDWLFRRRLYKYHRPWWQSLVLILSKSRKKSVHAFACPSPTLRLPSFFLELGACWPKILQLLSPHHFYDSCSCSFNPFKMKKRRKGGYDFSFFQCHNIIYHREC